MRSNHCKQSEAAHPPWSPESITASPLDNAKACVASLPCRHVKLINSLIVNPEVNPPQDRSWWGCVGGHKAPAAGPSKELLVRWSAGARRRLPLMAPSAAAWLW